MRRRWLLPAVAIVLALAAFAAGLLFSRPASAPATPLPPQAAVDRLLAAPLMDTAGREASLARWRGQPLVINFWATWCPPCLKEMPAFSRLQERHRQVQFIGIAVDTPENVRDFAARNPASYPLLVAGQETIPLMAELGNGRGGLPFTLGIDAGGQVRQVRLGALSEAETERLIAALR